MPGFNPYVAAAEFPTKEHVELLDPLEMNLNNLGNWHDPGTTWESTTYFKTKSFTAPNGLYGCVLNVAGITAKSYIMDHKYTSGAAYVSAPFEYETFDDGWILITTSACPIGAIQLDLMIKK